MLYISRVTDNGYYITGTEDGVEEVVDKEQLTEIIELGLKVQGVTYLSDYSFYNASF